MFFFMCDKEFNGNMLREGRTLRSQTVAELAEKTGITKQAISQYETGKITPDFSRISMLSKELKLPTDFFYQKSTYETTTQTTYFRALASTAKKDRKAQVIKLEYVAKLFKVLCEYVEFPEYNDPKVGFNDLEIEINDNGALISKIESAAEIVRRAWDIPSGPIENLQYILERNGVIVTGFNSDCQKIDAFSQQTEVDNQQIFLIALVLGTRSRCRLRMDMAHELGHIVLHPWGEDVESLSRDEFNKREMQANMFASALLLPRKEFGQDISKHPTDLEYYAYLKDKWGASIQAMIVRSHQLGIITSNQYQYLMRQVSKRGWRTCEPGDEEAYMLNESLFQIAIDILFENNVVTPELLMKKFEENGIALYSEMIEDLLMLKPDTLKREDCEVLPFVHLKENSGEKL